MNVTFAVPSPATSTSCSTAAWPSRDSVTRECAPGGPAISADTTNGSPTRTSGGAPTLFTISGRLAGAASAGMVSIEMPSAAARAISREASPAVARPSDTSTMRLAPSRGSARRAAWSAASMFVPAGEIVDVISSTRSLAVRGRSSAASRPNATTPARSPVRIRLVIALTCVSAAICVSAGRLPDRSSANITACGAPPTGNSTPAAANAVSAIMMARQTSAGRVRSCADQYLHSISSSASPTSSSTRHRLLRKSDAPARSASTVTPAAVVRVSASADGSRSASHSTVEAISTGNAVLSGSGSKSGRQFSTLASASVQRWRQQQRHAARGRTTSPPITVSLERAAGEASTGPPPIAPKAAPIG